MRLVTWNVHQLVQAVPAQLAALQELSPSLVALQEVSPRARHGLERGFRAAGLPNIVASIPTEGSYRFGLMVASNWPISVQEPFGALPYPERLLSVLVDAPFGTIELHNVHGPAKTSSGVNPKIGTFEGLHSLLARNVHHHRILCGDFNTPESKASHGKVLC